MDQNNYNSNWKKMLGFGNIQEKLENEFIMKLCIFLTLYSRAPNNRPKDFSSFIPQSTLISRLLG